MFGPIYEWRPLSAGPRPGHGQVWWLPEYVLSSVSAAACSQRPFLKQAGAPRSGSFSARPAAATRMQSCRKADGEANGGCVEPNITAGGAGPLFQSALLCADGHLCNPSEH